MTNRDVKPETYEPGVWHDWSGGENPVPGRRVEVQFGGDQHVGASQDWEWGWYSDGCAMSGDIIAFRLVEAPADKGSLPASPSVPGEGHGTGVVARLEKAEAELKRLRDAEWSDQSDEELGRCFKAFAEQVERQSGKQWSGDSEMRLGLMNMGLQQAIKMAAESNAETFTYTAEGFHSAGVKLGDWRVVIERVPPPPAASVSMGTSRKASETKAAVEAVNAELLEALEPFAKVGAQMMLTPDHRPLTLSGKAVEHDGALSNGTWTSLTAGAFRRATAAIAKATALEGGK